MNANEAIRLLPLLFEVVLLSVAVHKTVTYWATFKDLSSYKLIFILLRDQVLYFLMCVCPLTLTSHFKLADTPLINHLNEV